MRDSGEESEKGVKGIQNDHAALDKLFTDCYAEIFQAARRIMYSRMRGDLYEAEELMHDAYLKICTSRPRTWNDSKHFRCYTTLVLKAVLVDYVRKWTNREHWPPGGVKSLNSNMEIPSRAKSQDRLQEIILIAKSVAQLEKNDPLKAEIVILLYFGGLSKREVALELGMNPEKVKAEWLYARTWLKLRLKEGRRALEKGCTRDECD